MTTITPAAPAAVLADRVFPRSLATNALLVAGGAAITGAAAQVAVPLWPVPITGQTLAVLLVGATLGAKRGALSMALYAVLGIVGLPVFSDASSGFQVLAGPTGGYIIGFVAAAALTGWLAERAWDRTVLRAVVAFAAGTVMPFAFGLPWLAWALQLNLEQTLAAGLWPFLIGGAIKAAIAAGVVRAGWAYFGRRDRRA
ncbi:biotin transporter BioY [Herbiconiux sp. SYSU D00978]|uniref:biotin transporter BioY n=1 Tax=Herbiconiux sp. SYSU D00978 TaxID=2812562 RepID=UPI001A959CF5|nr:biotin transporter BioY [Herbiconiux sp. SYSU D00978]